jgi:predicted GIY-YIG superfamily endonuclease
MLEERLSAAKSIAERMRSGKIYTFAKLKPSDLPEKAAGVYAIYDINTGETLYVGRTKNIRRRLYTNHLMGPESNARLKKYLVHDDSASAITTMKEAKQYLRDSCSFQFIEEPDRVRRGQIEGLLSFLLDVRYIHEEH